VTEWVTEADLLSASLGWPRPRLYRVAAGWESGATTLKPICAPVWIMECRHNREAGRRSGLVKLRQGQGWLLLYIRTGSVLGRDKDRQGASGCGAPNFRDSVKAWSRCGGGPNLLRPRAIKNFDGAGVTDDCADSSSTNFKVLISDDAAASCCERNLRTAVLSQPVPSWPPRPPCPLLMNIRVFRIIAHETRAWPP
jgi:hypothetical protein